MGRGASTSAKSSRVSKHATPPRPRLYTPSYTPSETPFIHLSRYSARSFPFFPAGPLSLTLGFKILSFTRLYPVSRSEPLDSTGRNSLP